MFTSSSAPPVDVINKHQPIWNSFGSECCPLVGATKNTKSQLLQSEKTQNAQTETQHPPSKRRMEIQVFGSFFRTRGNFLRHSCKFLCSAKTRKVRFKPMEGSDCVFFRGMALVAAGGWKQCVSSALISPEWRQWSRRKKEGKEKWRKRGGGVRALKRPSCP